MERHLNLIKSEKQSEEKRVLPRFPFCFLTFRLEDGDGHAFKVKDISYSGMRVELTDGEIAINEHDQIKGALHWTGSKVDIGGNIVWKRENELGVEFINNPKLKEDVTEFLSIKNIVKNFKPLHREQFGLEIPTNLKFWLRADGPLEVFVWQHNDGELSKVQFILMENFVEWEDGQGIKTGTVKSKKSLETPLLNEDEFVFALDSGVNEEKINFARDIILHLHDDFITHEAKSFILRKLPTL
jgi:hypothetical protein